MANEGASLLQENTVQYHLFCNAEKVSGSALSYLRAAQDKYLAHMATLLSDYIWQKDSFTLSAALCSKTSDYVPCLEGQTCFGDNIEDEWFIVYLLMELTSNFSELIVRVTDNDGEFLLIEAANALPKWLNPDTGDKRVYLYGGDVHIIPMPDGSAGRDFLPLFTPSVSEAIECIKTHRNVTLADDSIQKCITKRLSAYPDCIKQNVHYANCYIPAGLAAILDKDPSLISAAVNSFYYRDPIDLRSCRTMKYFRPGTRVMRQVKFTRCLYAQLMQQKFQPDRRSGWIMPTHTHRDFVAHDLGMKLAHGAEILCSQSSENHTGNFYESESANTSRWMKFVTSLTNIGYFKAEAEGSKLYRVLLDNAKRFYYSSISDDRKLLQPGARYLSLLNSLSFDIEQMRREADNLPPSDDDSWLNITEADLNRIFENHHGHTTQQISENELISNMNSFVDSISSYEGVEVTSNDLDHSTINPDAPGYIQSMQKLFECNDEESSDSSDMSEYGSHSNDDGEDFICRNKPNQKPTKKPPTSNKPQQPINKPERSLNKPQKLAYKPEQSSKKPQQTRVEPQLSSKQPQKPTDKPQQSMIKPQLYANGTQQTPKKPSVDTKIEGYMRMMDRELANTTIGQSFQCHPVAPPRRKRANQAVNKRDIDDEDDGFRPVNIEANLVRNMLASYSQQQGLPGPSSTILGSMGLSLPAESSNSSQL